MSDPLSAGQIEVMNEYRHAANYLTVHQGVQSGQAGDTGEAVESG